ncbi:hypothetical protein DPMN_138819 [Dreissena polymorpha]|uniref:Uncharacterized protein n=1 Tax=Dreissena polymorpha TaxID=45954 RepID=A0A9D4JK70_DREPO|nr:hypothetical protein DPMN_138819 [Dreissena polymorpha]
MSNADADGLSRRPDVNISSEQNTIETPVIKAASLAASVSKDQAPLIFSVAAPTDSAHESTVGDVPLDVIETESLTSRDWRKSQANDPVIGQVATHLRNGTRPSLSGSIPIIMLYLNTSGVTIRFFFVMV